MTQSDSQKICQIAFSRLEDLWEAWCESRRETRIQILKTIVTNLQLIILHGSDDDIEHLIEYIDNFHIKLRIGIADALKAEREQTYMKTLH